MSGKAIVIGLTALPSGGKDYTADILVKKYHFYKVSPGEVIREKIRDMGIKSFDRKAQQDLQDKLRKKYGKYYVMELCYQKIRKSGKKRIVIPGIRFPFDISFYKKKYDGRFINIYIDAPVKVRYRRAVKRQREDAPKSYAQFLKEDERERMMFKLEKTKDLSDIRINNSVDNSNDLKKDIEVVMSYLLSNTASSISR